MVPPAEFTSYYGKPILKPPVWKSPDVPAYLYLGGLAGASAVMAAMSDLTGSRELRRVGRVVAAGGATVSVGALIHDLGRPLRFLHMLRVFKPTSPLSVGSWILSPFSALTAAAAASELTGRLPVLGSLAGAGAGVLGPAMTTYTAVLFSDTAVPVWHEAHRELPFVFAGSSLASAGGAALAVAPIGTAKASRRMAVAGAVLEVAASRRMEDRLGPIGAVYKKGRAGTAMRASRAVTLVGAASALISTRSRVAGAVSGVLLNAGAATLRYAVFAAGTASAEDPEYTVVPQRQRLEARAQDAAGTTATS